jgi:predicted CoA-binding protein
MSEPGSRTGGVSAAPEELTDILRKYHTIAVVGLSADPSRPSYQVAQYLQAQGYRIIPVNPNCREVLGEPCYASLRDIPEPVDIVDIFRQIEAIPGIVAEAIAIGAKVVWMQLGLEHPEAADRASQAGLKVVMNRCMKVEHARLR